MPRTVGDRVQFGLGCTTNATFVTTPLSPAEVTYLDSLPPEVFRRAIRAGFDRAQERRGEPHSTADFEKLVAPDTLYAEIKSAAKMRREAAAVCGIPFEAIEAAREKWEKSIERESSSEM